MHVIDPTNPRRALGNGIEDRLHVRRRTADDAEYLGRRRLMLQRLAQLCVALRISLNSRTFSMAITAWAAKVSNSVICLSVKGPTSLRRMAITPRQPLRAAGESLAQSESQSLMGVVRKLLSSARSGIWIVFRLRKPRPDRVPRQSVLRPCSAWASLRHAPP